MINNISVADGDPTDSKPKKEVSALYYLYIKTHNITNLKYLGMTKKQNPYSYLGSGFYWLRHLKKYGRNISTKIIFESEDFLLFQGACLFYSYLYNIVESEEWANLCIETGLQGGVKGQIPWNKGKHHSIETCLKISISNSGKPKPYVIERNKLNPPAKGKPKSEEHKKKLRMINIGENNPQYGKTPSIDTRQKMILSRLGKKRGKYKKRT